MDPELPLSSPPRLQRTLLIDALIWATLKTMPITWPSAVFSTYRFWCVCCSDPGISHKKNIDLVNYAACHSLCIPQGVNQRIVYRIACCGSDCSLGRAVRTHTTWRSWRRRSRARRVCVGDRLQLGGRICVTHLHTHRYRRKGHKQHLCGSP